jgi:hypothetical protein
MLNVWMNRWPRVSCLSAALIVAMVAGCDPATSLRIRNRSSDPVRVAISWGDFAGKRQGDSETFDLRPAGEATSIYFEPTSLFAEAEGKSHLRGRWKQGPGGTHWDLDIYSDRMNLHGPSLLESIGNLPPIFGCCAIWLAALVAWWCWQRGRNLRSS